MGPGRLFWKLFLGNVLLMALVLITCLWLISREVDHFQDLELTRHLEIQARTLREIFEDRFDAAHATELNTQVQRIARQQPDHVRITLILANGTVLADSESDPAHMESHADRLEVRKALANGYGEEVRMSHTLGRNLKYLAVSVEPSDPHSHTSKGVVRVAMPVRTISEQIGPLRRLIWETGLAALAAIALLALGLAQLWSRPIRRITLAARSLSRGDLSTEVRIGGSDELTQLARSINEMRQRLSGQLETIDRQRRTLESLLTQLHEGVVVAGPHGHVVLINPAAVRMLNLRADCVEAMTTLPGQAVEQCIPQHELQQMLLAPAVQPGLVRPTGEAETVREVRLQPLDGGPEMTVLARASEIVLPSFRPSEEEAHLAGSPRPGRLLVLTDVTQFTRLMQVKADFAANASHELRTPLSAIRAAVETLLHVDLAQETESARSFISVIERHSRRLELLVADLLELSRLESPRAQFEAKQVRLDEMLAELQEQNAERLKEKRLHWDIDLPTELNLIMANPHLLRVVLDNLVDNSIKFTEPGGHVRIICQSQPKSDTSPDAISICVADDGCGIPPDEQTRVFERFYQVERARSGGVLRGTGLGLSIVRHAVAAMKASVNLQSELGKGTRITVTIPQPEAYPA